MDYYELKNVQGRHTNEKHHRGSKYFPNDVFQIGFGLVSITNFLVRNARVSHCFWQKLTFPQVVGTCVLVISVLGWFVNVIQSNSANAAARQKNPNPKAQPGRSEIENLLKELTGEKRKPKPEPKEAKREAQPARSQKPQNERKSKPNQAGSRGGQKQPAPVRSAPRSTESGLPSAHLGDGLRAHHLGNRVDAAVQKEITSAVKQDLGTPLAVPALFVTPVHPLVAVLQNPQGVRQAILLNEVLQRPKALRRS